MDGSKCLHLINKKIPFDFNENNAKKQREGYWGLRK